MSVSLLELSPYYLGGAGTTHKRGNVRCYPSSRKALPCRISDKCIYQRFTQIMGLTTNQYADRFAAHVRSTKLVKSYQSMATISVSAHPSRDGLGKHDRDQSSIRVVFWPKALRVSTRRAYIRHTQALQRRPVRGKTCRWFGWLAGSRISGNVPTWRQTRHPVTARRWTLPSAIPGMRLRCRCQHRQPHGERARRPCHFSLRTPLKGFGSAF